VLEKPAFPLRLTRLLREAVESPIAGTPRLFLPPSVYKTPAMLRGWESDKRQLLGALAERLAQRVFGSPEGMGRLRSMARAGFKSGVENPDVFLLTTPLAFTPTPPGTQPAAMLALAALKRRLLGLP